MSCGSSMAGAMHGRAEANGEVTPIHADPTHRGRCCDFFCNTGGQDRRSPSAAFNRRIVPGCRPPRLFWAARRLATWPDVEADRLGGRASRARPPGHRWCTGSPTILRCWSNRAVDNAGTTAESLRGRSFHWRSFLAQLDTVKSIPSQARKKVLAKEAPIVLGRRLALPWIRQGARRRLGPLP